MLVQSAIPAPTCARRSIYVMIALYRHCLSGGQGLRSRFFETYKHAILSLTTRCFLKERRVASLLSSQAKADDLQSLDDGSDKTEAVAQVKETRRSFALLSQRDETQDPALSRRGFKSEPFCR